MIAYAELGAETITDRFPELREQTEAETVDGEFLPHVVFGNVFNRLTEELLMRDGHLSDETLHRIFDMYEEFAAEGDEEVQNLVQVTLLEPLWDDKTIYDRAEKLLGEHTRELWNCIGSYLREPS